MKIKIKKKTISSIINIAIEILKLILSGLTESEAINLAAKKHSLSFEKANKIWKKYKKHKKHSIIT